MVYKQNYENIIPCLILLFLEYNPNAYRFITDHLIVRACKYFCNAVEKSHDYECQKTAKVRRFMDTFYWLPKSVHKTAKVRSFVDTWDKDDFRQPKSVHKTAKVRSFCNFELRQPKSVHKTA